MELRRKQENGQRGEEKSQEIAAAVDARAGITRLSSLSRSNPRPNQIRLAVGAIQTRWGLR
jgi:hypothetical protein